jgi:fluoride exporter
VVDVSASTWLAVALFGGLGAIGRFVVDGAISARGRGTFPSGTLAVNLVGALGLGVLVSATTDEQSLHLIATGLLGSFTTFSTWMFESQRLAEDGELRVGLTNVIASLLVGLAAVWLGQQVGELL